MSQTMQADMQGMIAPGVNDSSEARGTGGKAKGGLQRQPTEKGVSPNMTAPQRAKPQGNAKPGSPSNRNLSLASPPARLPGSAAAARA